MTVAEIAKRIKREPAEIVKKLFMMGVMATQNQSLDGETIGTPHGGLRYRSQTKG